MLTLKTITIFNSLNPEDQTLESLLASHLLSSPLQTNQDPSELALQLAQELDEVITYFKSIAPPPSKSNLLARFGEFLSNPDYEQALILMSRFNPTLADEWFTRQPALRAIKALRLFSEYEMQRVIAEYECMVYSQGGTISSPSSSESIKKPLESYAPVSVPKQGSKFAEAMAGMQI